MKKTILVFGFLILALLLLFQFSKYRFISGDLQIEYIMGFIAITFLGLGLFINKRTKKRIPVSNHKIDLDKVKELGLSKREYEVLKEVALGLSNQEIAEKLFVSESTIKTHVSNLLLKLDAKRRTQAIQISKNLNII
ncbi:response regulator transcription factor [Winogradskyella sp. UBA3174]|uniref:response regulator transcription factor n=1 Tax=Winogradskyella sp. UBA3174 TaxID=1947785 RepID=UPI0025DEB145|nr:response regulator transcription factor [Winogradskyella sp. UBA3174]|tara:strand:+ start:15366 stop:15776 length:411 start_codon:yes stop_codon:yes gene_type:complete